VDDQPRQPDQPGDQPQAEAPADPPPRPPRGPDRQPRKRRGTDSPEKAAFRDRLVNSIADMLSRGAFKSEAVQAIQRRYAASELWGRSCSRRTAEAVISKARELLCNQHGQSKLEHHRSSFSYYWSVLRDPNATVSERLSARTRLDKLLGLEAPLEHRHAGAGGGPIQHCPIDLSKLNDEQLARLEELVMQASLPTEVIVRSRVEARELLKLDETAEGRARIDAMMREVVAGQEEAARNGHATPPGGIIR
jgi:hypothetical protein